MFCSVICSKNLLRTARLFYKCQPKSLSSASINTKFQHMSETKGKVVLITGSTSGIGLEAAKEFYRLGYSVLLTCRDEVKGRNALDVVLSSEKSKAEAERDQQRVHLYSLDLMSYESILTCCEEIRSDWKHLDCLVLNAGIMGKEFELSSDGIESHFATNMFGHYVIVNQLYEILSNKEEISRVIVITSGLYTGAPYLPSIKKLMGEQHWENYSSRDCYAISKLANCLYTKEFSKRFRDHGGKVQIFAVRPGFIRGTELGRETHWFLRMIGAPLIYLFSQPVSKAILPIMYLANDDLGELKSGSLYNNDCKEEDYNAQVCVANRQSLVQILYEMENLVLKRRDLPEDKLEEIKKRRDWYIKA